MAIRSRTNQYLGVNAHFNSQAQHELDGWKSFHARYIVALGDLMDANLPPGYELHWESSLQIREYDPESGEPLDKPKRPEPDIGIWKTGQQTSSNPLHGQTGYAPMLIKPALEVLSKSDEAYLTAIVIYERADDGATPVARIEFLSPSNKIGGSNYEKYIAKQDLALRAGGASLTVIDFLHQTDSVIPGVPSYPRQEEGAYPYTIAIIDPRPSLEAGQAWVYGVHVDEALPKLTIPLAGQDVVLADFNAAYHTAFKASSSFSNRADYSQVPVAFETYTSSDQARILHRMDRVKQAYEAGLDLEQAPTL